MVDVEAGLKYPFRGDGALTTLAIGGGAPMVAYAVTMLAVVASAAVPALGVVSILVIPLQLAVGVLWMGYFVRVARTTLEGETSPPPFGDLGTLTRDGLVGTLVGLVYYVPLFVVTLVGYVLILLAVLGAGSGLEGGGDQLAITAGVLGSVGVLVFVVVVSVLGMAVTYLLPISLVAYAAEDRVGAAFSLDTLLTVGRSGEYVKPWAAAFGVYLLLSTVLGFLSILVIGLLLQPFAYFYVGMAAFHMFAQGYASETGLTVPQGTAEDGAVAPASGSDRPRAPEDV